MRDCDLLSDWDMCVRPWWWEGGSRPTGHGFLSFGSPLLASQMATACHCLSLLLLSTCVALLVQPPLGAQGAPLEPVYPGDNATLEQMAQYAAELRRYINMLTRPRCVEREGERSQPLGHDLRPCPFPALGKAETLYSPGSGWDGAQGQA